MLDNESQPIRPTQQLLGSALRKLFLFSALAEWPDPDKLIRDAEQAIRDHPLSALMPTSHHDSEGKVIHRTPGGLDNAAALRQQIATAESIRRKIVVSGKLEPARHVLKENHYLSEDVFASPLEVSPFVPHDLVLTFARGFTRFFQGDFISAAYILTPLLENSLRHILKQGGHDVTKFDEVSQTQQDRPINSLFEQMRAELDATFGRKIVADIENVFLSKPGPYFRHSLAHGLLSDGDAYSPDSVYASWLIFRLCLIPLYRHENELAFPWNV